MPTFRVRTASPSVLAQNITATLARLRQQRFDADPTHNVLKCRGCPICATEQLLNKYLDLIPRRNR